MKQFTAVFADLDGDIFEVATLSAAGRVSAYRKAYDWMRKQLSAERYNAPDPEYADEHMEQITIEIHESAPARIK